MKRLKERIKGNIGNLVFAAVKMIKPKDTTVIYAGPLMGDALYSLAFLEEYRRREPKKKIVVWTSPKLAEIVATYKGYDKIVIIYSAVLRKLLWQMWNSDISLHQRTVENGLLNQFAFRGTYPSDNELSILRDRIFRVGPQASISYHHLVPKKVNSIPGFYEKCNKIIVLNPYSSTTHLPAGIVRSFERLAKWLENDGNAGGGYTVYTNVIKDQRPIPGTKELRCGLAEFLEIAAHIPLIVSVRSGILDLAVTTNVNMYVLYSEGAINAKSFGLAAWQCKGKIREVTFSEFLDDDHFDDMDEWMKSIKG